MKLLILLMMVILMGCSKTFDPNDLLDPTSTMVKQILTGGKKK